MSSSWSGRSCAQPPLERVSGSGKSLGGRRERDQRPGPDRLLHGVRYADLAEVPLERLFHGHPPAQTADEVHGLDAIRIGERLERLREQHLKAETQRVREPASGDQTGRGHDVPSLP